jgi:hypothetical protein
MAISERDSIIVLNPTLSVVVEPIGNALPDRNKTAIDKEVSSRLVI